MSSLAVALLAAAGCSKVTVKQEPFAPLAVTAQRPPPPPPPPRVVVTEKAIEIKEKVHFEFDKAEIRPESFGLLDEVAKVLTDNPHIMKVEVQGHTDAIGGAKYNQGLSEARAAAVRDYLVGKGIVAERLSSKGYGLDVPIADNTTEEGREQNRRVEFKIMEQTQKQAETQPAASQPQAQEQQP